MSLGGTDLNLLLSLKVLLEEGNVTRAGQRLGLSQPAMSAALARLRRKFDDELLTRSGRDYELTPVAVELLPEVQHALRLISKALDVEEGFDPSTSERTFRLTMSDYAIAIVHEPLLARVSELAPGVRLKIDPLGPESRSSDRILLENDALIAPRGFGFPGESRPLWLDRMVCLLDSRHRSLGDGGLTLEDLANLPHAVATFGPGTLTPVDRVFGELAGVSWLAQS
jgi:DNA-binding transcriptional LysR family regulator